MQLGQSFGLQIHAEEDVAGRMNFLPVPLDEPFQTLGQADRPFGTNPRKVLAVLTRVLLAERVPLDKPPADPPTILWWICLKILFSLVPPFNVGVFPVTVGVLPAEPGPPSKVFVAHGRIPSNVCGHLYNSEIRS